MSNTPSISVDLAIARQRDGGSSLRVEVRDQRPWRRRLRWHLTIAAWSVTLGAAVLSLLTGWPPTIVVLCQVSGAVMASGLYELARWQTARADDRARLPCAAARELPP